MRRSTCTSRSWKGLLFSLAGSAQYVTQEPGRTAMWPSVERESLSSASFATGVQRFELFLPYLQEGQSASDVSGWSSYGKPVAYQSFDFRVRPGEQGREIGGHPAPHFGGRFRQKIREWRGRLDPHDHDQRSLSAGNKRFNLAPFATVGACGEPRLAVALSQNYAH